MCTLADAIKLDVLNEASIESNHAPLLNRFMKVQAWSMKGGSALPTLGSIAEHFALADRTVD